MKKKIFYSLIVILIVTNLLFSQIPLSNSSAWSVGSGNYPTGIGWADIDNNGWLDLAVGNGLDIAFKPNMVYFSYNGIVSTSPGWISSDLYPSDKIVLNDFNKDGFIDLVVSNLGYTPGGLPAVPQLYYQNINGMLSQNPTIMFRWANSFACAMGDVNGDGYIDIAFAQGDHYTSQLQRSVIYLNNKVSFDTIPVWRTYYSYYASDIDFLDIDNDGDLDLALGGDSLGIALFKNNEGILDSIPFWNTSGLFCGRQFAFGDIDNDGFFDLAVAGGSHHRFYLFKNRNGILDTFSSWLSVTYLEPSNLSWGDVDNDGYLDLAGCTWAGYIGVFKNNGGSLTNQFAWVQSVSGCPQQVVWTDYDKDGLIDTIKTIISDGTKKLFYIKPNPIFKINQIKINNSVLSNIHYCYDLSEGWISFDSKPQAGDTLKIFYTYSKDLDLTSSAYQVNIFKNTSAISVKNTGEFVNDYKLKNNYPNPFNPKTVIGFSLKHSGKVKLEIFDISGRVIVTLVNGSLNMGSYECEWDASSFSSGVYFYRIEVNEFSDVKKMILLK